MTEHSKDADCNVHRPLTSKERKELRRLHGKWARRTASMAEMDRSRDLQRRDDVDRRSGEGSGVSHG